MVVIDDILRSAPTLEQQWHSANKAQANSSRNIGVCEVSRSRAEVATKTSQGLLPPTASPQRLLKSNDRHRALGTLASQYIPYTCVSRRDQETHGSIWMIAQCQFGILTWPSQNSLTQRDPNGRALAYALSMQPLALSPSRPAHFVSGQRRLLRVVPLSFNRSACSAREICGESGARQRRDETSGL